MNDILTRLAYRGNETAMDIIEEYLALYWAEKEWEVTRREKPKGDNSMKKWVCMTCLHVWKAWRRPRNCPNCNSTYIVRGAKDLRTTEEREKGNE